MTRMPALLAPDELIRTEPLPGSPAWLAQRRTGIGGSDVAAALGVSPWMSPYELWLDKRGELPPREDVEGRMRWGVLVEPLVLQEYERITGCAISRPRMLRSETHPWMLANLDGLRVDHTRVVEAKTARTAEGWGEPGSDEVPEHYLLQGQHYMAITGIALTDFAVLIGGSDFRIYTVPADAELQAMLIEAEATFWQRVLDADPPPVVSVDDARHRWGRLTAKGAVQADESALQAVEELRQASSEHKALEGLIETRKANLMAALGADGDTLVDARGRPLVTWKLAAAPQRFDLEAFAAEQPTLAAHYTRAGTPSRRFLLKPAPTTTGVRP